jgi:hypothetical protein
VDIVLIVNGVGEFEGGVDVEEDYKGEGRRGRKYFLIVWWG